MLEIIMIRHFATQGNLKKRYIGVTDEPLSEIGKQSLQKKRYPNVEAVFASPLLRCMETVNLIYPKQVPILDHDFSECDFGEFENKNYIELSDNPKYLAWIESKGTLPFPGGEDPGRFKARSVTAFDRMVDMSFIRGYQRVALVAHGGTIMSILDQYSAPHQDYFHWQVENGEGYLAEAYFSETEERRLVNICIIPS